MKSEIKKLGKTRFPVRLRMTRGQLTKLIKEIGYQLEAFYSYKIAGKTYYSDIIGLSYPQWSSEVEVQQYASRIMQSQTVYVSAN